MCIKKKKIKSNIIEIVLLLTVEKWLGHLSHFYFFWQ